MAGEVDRRASVAVAILAGGAGTRMGGVAKRGLRVGGRSVLDRQLEVLRGRFSRILMVLGPEAGPGSASDLPADLVVLRDRVPGRSGPLAGLDAVLAALTPEEEGAVCLAADMPLLSGPPLDLLRDTAPSAQALVPLVGGQPEPLFARYNRSCAPAIADLLRHDRLRTMGLLAEVRVHWLPEPTLRLADPTLACLENINTPEDLARIETLLAASPHT